MEVADPDGRMAHEGGGVADDYRRWLMSLRGGRVVDDRYNKEKNLRNNKS